MNLKEQGRKKGCLIGWEGDGGGRLGLRVVIPIGGGRHG